MSLAKVVLVTGSEGFLGKEVCALFRKDHAYKLISTDKVNGADLVGDLANPDFVKNLPECDLLVNCAAVQYVTNGKPIFFKKPFFLKNNVSAMRNLLDRYSGNQTPHVVHVGTSMVYRMTGQESYSEESELHGQGVYSTSKLCAQKLLHESGFDYAVVVPCIIGGEGRGGLFSGLIKSLSLLGIAFIPGTGKNRTSIVHKHDVASLIKLISDLRSSGVYNAASSDASTFNEWAAFVANKLKKKLKILNLPLAPIKLISKISNYNVLASEQLYMLEFSHVLDIEKSLKLGWRPKYSAEQIIDEIVANELKTF